MVCDIGPKSTENHVFKTMMMVYERWVPENNWALFFEFGNQDKIDHRLFEEAIELHTPPNLRGI
jgi:hypothetical protein